MREKFDNIIVWLTLLLFALFFLYIAFHNRLSHGDDMFFFAEVQDKGIIQPLIDFEHNTRYSSFFVFNSIFYSVKDFTDIPLFIFIYYSLFLISFIISTVLFVRCMVNFFSDKNPSFSIFFPLSVYIIIALFFGAPQLVEVWFWTLASTIYGLPVIAALFGFYAIFSEGYVVRNYILIVFSFLFIGGALETFALSCGVLLLLLLFLSFRFQKLYFLRWRVLTAGCSILAFLSLNFISGGNNNRLSLESKASSSLPNNFYDFIESFFDQNNTIVLLCILFLFIHGGIAAKRMTVPVFNIRKTALINMLFLAIVALVTIIPMWIVFKSWGPKRAWIPFHFFLLMSIFFWSFYYGLRSNYLHSFNWMKGTFSSLILFLLIALCIRSFPKLSKYSQAYDHQIDAILHEKEKKRIKTYEVKEMPETGYVVRFKLDKDSTHWYNRMMKRALKTDFYFISKE